MNEKKPAVARRTYTHERVQQHGVQVIARIRGVSRKGYLMRGFDFLDHDCLKQPEIIVTGEAGIFHRHIWNESAATAADRDFHKREQALRDASQASVLRPVFDARKLMHMETPESKAILQEIYALIGQRLLNPENLTPFDFSRGASVGTLRGWVGDGQYHLVMDVRPDEFLVAIEISHKSACVNARLEVPGEILGLHKEEGYSSLYFSLERCERSANLFSLFDVMAVAILESMNLAKAKDDDRNLKQK